MNQRAYTITVIIEADNSNAFPNRQELANGIFDGLPKEWYDINIDEYAIVSILGTTMGPIVSVDGLDQMGQP